MISFNSRTLFTLRDRHGLASIKLRSRPAMEQLNQIWRMHKPVQLHLVHKSADEIGIQINGASVIDVLPGDAEGRKLSDVAQQWSGALAEAFRTEPSNAAAEVVR